MSSPAQPNGEPPRKCIRYHWRNIQSNVALNPTNTGRCVGGVTAFTQSRNSVIASFGSRPSRASFSIDSPHTSTACFTKFALSGFNSA